MRLRPIAIPILPQPTKANASFLCSRASLLVLSLPFPAAVAAVNAAFGGKEAACRPHDVVTRVIIYLYV